MSTVAEIETALEQLPTEQMLAVAAWLDERRSMLGASEAMFQQLDEAEGGRREPVARRMTRGEIWMIDLGMAAKVFSQHRHSRWTLSGMSAGLPRPVQTPPG